MMAATLVIELQITEYGDHTVIDSYTALTTTLVTFTER